VCSSDLQECLFRGQELSCIVNVESNYFFNDVWGLTVRASQIKFYGGDEDEDADAPVVLEKCVCAHLE